VLNWSAWLPNWPALISNGLVPLAFLMLGFFMLDEVVLRRFKASLEERVLFLFTFLLVAFVILTLTGIFFRGEGMQLMWPWLVGAAH